MGKTKKLLKGTSLLSLPDQELKPIATQLGARPLSERVMVVRFSVGRWYGRGADRELVDAIKVQKGARGEIGTFTKRLMDMKHLAEINRITNEARAYFKQKTLPYDDNNVRLLAVEHFFEVKKKMTGYDRAFGLAVQRFIAVYQGLVVEEKKRLGGLWKESDYPSVEGLKERFRFELHFRPLESADDLRINLPKEELDAIRKEIEEGVMRQINDALRGLIDRLRAMLEEVHRRMADPKERLPISMVEDLRAFCADLPTFNITNDPHIAKAASALNSLFASMGSSTEMIHDESKRDASQKEMSKVLSALSVLQKKGASK